mgnify:CR=1 FL=1
MRAPSNALHQWEAVTRMADQGLCIALRPWAPIKEIAIFFNKAESY